VLGEVLAGMVKSKAVKEKGTGKGKGKPKKKAKAAKKSAEPVMAA
jgi:hypothetical protein